MKVYDRRRFTPASRREQARVGDMLWYSEHISVAGETSCGPLGGHFLQRVKTARDHKHRNTEVKAKQVLRDMAA